MTLGRCQRPSACLCVGQGPSAWYLQSGSFGADESLSSLHKALSVADHGAHFDDVTGHVVLQDADRLATQTTTTTTTKHTHTHTRRRNKVKKQKDKPK